MNACAINQPTSTSQHQHTKSPTAIHTTRVCVCAPCAVRDSTLYRVVSYPASSAHRCICGVATINRMHLAHAPAKEMLFTNNHTTQSHPCELFLFRAPLRVRPPRSWKRTRTRERRGRAAREHQLRLLWNSTASACDTRHGPRDRPHGVFH